MPRYIAGKLLWKGTLLSVVLATLTTVAAEDPAGKIQGVIKGRSGANMIVQTTDYPRLIVVLTNNTKVSQIKGVLKARREDMSMAALVPGLIIQVEGTFNVDRQLVASSVRFKGDDLKQAQAIQAGLHETQVKTQQHQEELEKHNAALQDQNAALKQQQEQLAAGKEQIAANKAAIDAANARFGQLDEYNVLDEVTVLFANGKTALDPKYKPDLMKLADNAKGVQGYMVQITGYASSSGSEELNQKLSEDRAHSISIFLSQQGHIPLTNMLAPGAMGESRQVGDLPTGTDAEAANRRVVVRVLQNKGVAGTSGTGQ
jgi:outer membrane protein OmpA-like peptidoglycan-associated protein